MTAENHITGYLLANENTLVVNGEQTEVQSEERSVSAFCKQLYDQYEIKYPKFYKMDRQSKLAFVTSEILLQQNNFSEKYAGNEIGIVMSNKNSSLDTDIRFQESMNEFASPSLFVYTLPNIMEGEICIKNKIMGENAFFIFEQPNWGFMCNYVNDLIKNGQIKACLMGWVDVLNDNFTSVLFLVEKEKINTELNLMCKAEVLENLYKKGNY